MCELCKAKERILQLESELKEYKNYTYHLTDFVDYFLEKKPITDMRQLVKIMKQFRFTAAKLPNNWTMYNQDEKAKAYEDD